MASSNTDRAQTSNSEGHLPVLRLVSIPFLLSHARNKDTYFCAEKLVLNSINSYLSLTCDCYERNFILNKQKFVRVVMLPALLPALPAL